MGYRRGFDSQPIGRLRSKSMCLSKRVLVEVRCQTRAGCPKGGKKSGQLTRKGVI